MLFGNRSQVTEYAGPILISQSEGHTRTYYQGSSHRKHTRRGQNKLNVSGMDIQNTRPFWPR